MSDDAMRQAKLDAELKAMREIDAALRTIDIEARSRVLRWACAVLDGSFTVGEDRDK